MKKRKRSSSGNDEGLKSIHGETNEGKEEEKDEDLLDYFSHIDSMLNFPDNLDVYNNEEMKTPTKTDEDHSHLLEAVDDNTLEFPQIASMNPSDTAIQSHYEVSSNTLPTTNRRSSEPVVDLCCEEGSKAPATTNSHTSEPKASPSPMANMHSLQSAADRSREEAISKVPSTESSDPTKQTPRRPSEIKLKICPDDRAKQTRISWHEKLAKFYNFEIELANCPDDQAKEALIRWYWNLAKFHKFVKVFHDANVPSNFKDEELVDWVKQQRVEYTQKLSGKGLSYLTDKKLSELNKAGFKWSPSSIESSNPKICYIRKGSCRPSEIELRNCEHNRAKQALINWYWNLDKFYTFKEVFGNDKSLVIWQNKQRFQYRQIQKGKGSSYLTEKKLSELNKAGFIWKDSKDNWEERFEELKQFKKERGHCKVPTKKNRELGRWVSLQRSRKKDGMLDHKRFQELDKIGFSWSEQSKKTVNNTPGPETIEIQEEQTEGFSQIVKEDEAMDVHRQERNNNVTIITTNDDDNDDNNNNDNKNNDENNDSDNNNTSREDELLEETINRLSETEKYPHS